MDKRLYPISPLTFKQWILVIIEKYGKVDHQSSTTIKYSAQYYYIAYRNILLPKCYVNWHSIYMRFQRGNERGLWWKILVSLQKEKKSKNECCHLVLMKNSAASNRVSKHLHLSNGFF